LQIQTSVSKDEILELQLEPMEPKGVFLMGTTDPTQPHGELLRNLPACFCSMLHTSAMIRTCPDLFSVLSSKSSVSISNAIYFTGKLVSRFSTHLQFCKLKDKSYWRNVGTRKQE